MRLPFNLDEAKFNDKARVKFSFTSPELHQNIEISLDGEETTVETLLDAFQRFLGALGISTPDNVLLGFVQVDDEEYDDEDEDDDDEPNLGNDKSKKTK
jgi:hypothetical protein